VKYSAERALKHLSEGGGSQESDERLLSAAFNNYLASSAEADTRKFVKDFVSKYTSKQPLDSDDED
jgi:hypothetical protein